MMKILTSTDVKEQFGSFLKAVKTKPIIITKRGLPSCVVLNLSDLNDEKIVAYARELTRDLGNEK